MTTVEALYELWTSASVSSETRSIAIKAIEALKKAEKYRWHDLRKNPDDFPHPEFKMGSIVDEKYLRMGGLYLVCFEDGLHGLLSYGIDVWCKRGNKTVEVVSCGWFDEYGDTMSAEEFRIVAWKCFEPFEEVSE